MTADGAASRLVDLRRSVRRYHRATDAEALERLLPLAQLEQPAVDRVQSLALALSERVRALAAGESGVQALLNEYDLNSEEGIVLMCLAEALLRIPDNETADQLIQDKILKGDWAANLESDDSFFVHASAWGLLLTGKVVGLNRPDERAGLFGLGKVVGRLGEPVIRAAMRQAMRIMGTQFVLGQSIEKACQNARNNEQRGYRYSYDMLGEASRTQETAEAYLTAYRRAIEHIGHVSTGRDCIEGPGISIKLSALHPRYEYANSQRVHAEMYPRLKELVLLARQFDIGVSIDAEEADRLELSLDLIERLLRDPDLGNWQGFGVVVQAYQKRALEVLRWLLELARVCQQRIMIRLVKGAYWDAEIKLAQVEGLAGYPVFTRKASTDASYRACARLLLENRDLVYPQFATHNANTVAAILEMAGEHDGFEFQRLHGMGDELYASLREKVAVPCRIYAPVGEHEDLLAYLVRRLLENGANTSFVNKILDDRVPLESLVADPVSKVRSWQAKAHPGILLPANIYGEKRLNSSGIDLQDAICHAELECSVAKWTEQLVQTAERAQGEPSVNPADTRQIIARVPFATPAELLACLHTAEQAFAGWSLSTASERATILRAFADKLQAHEAELISLCCKEAGKTLHDGVGEVREAIDFCRYYACQAEQMQADEPSLKPLGVVLCISPWNFPLAIFLGQLSAALAAGNTVLAKPAEQTCQVALRAGELLKASGLPEGVLQVVCARGIDTGEHLVGDERIQAVLFTGSTRTARWIAERLAQRPGRRIPLIAETGGQNCMLADTTALTEQLVDDVISSAFRSAGQRCSALRVLYIQEEAADSTIRMLAGAMAELSIGDPACLQTDVGPLIDEQARRALTEHQAYLDGLCVGGKARLVYACSLGSDCSNGTFFAPRLYEIDDISLLRGEVFGPVLHVIRYRASELSNVLEAINSTGFGLTAGVHSRIDLTCKRFSEQIRAGNIYVNRNTIGAIVGVQPFGGRGLSGTGPKAGGPSYLYRLCAEPIDSPVESLPELFPDLATIEPTACSPASMEDQIQGLHATAQQWRALTLETRCAALKNTCEQLPESGQLLTEINALYELAQMEYAAQQLLGPTGESNVLSVDPRGVLLALGPSQSPHSVRQIFASLLAGNAVLRCVPAESEPAIAASEFRFNPDIPFQNARLNSAAELLDVLLNHSIDGVVSHAADAELRGVDRALRQREGELLPLVTETRGLALLKRLVLERHVSTDTTASGGNASLLALGELD